MPTLIGLHGYLQRIVDRGVSDRDAATDGTAYLDFLGMTGLDLACQARGIRGIFPAAQRGANWAARDHREVIRLVEESEPPRVIAGFSDGGTHAVAIALERPDLFVGMVCHSGMMPRRYAPLPLSIARLWIVTAEQAAVVSRGVNRMYAEDSDLANSTLLTQADGKYVGLRGNATGHWWSPQTTEAVLAWVLEIVGKTQGAV